MPTRPYLGVTNPDVQQPIGSVNEFAKALRYLAWTEDPFRILTSNQDTSGSIHGAACFLSAGDYVTTLAEFVVTAGVGMTHGIFAIYDQNLNLLGNTADTPAAFQVTNAWVELPLITPVIAPYHGLYYLFDLLATGTTMPAIGTGGTNAPSSGRMILPNGASRGFSPLGTFTSFPTTMGANNGTGIGRVILAR